LELTNTAVAMGRGKNLVSAQTCAGGLPRRGMAFMLLSTLTNAVMIASIQYLSSEVHPFVIAFFRAFFGLLILAPLLLRAGLAPLYTRRPVMHLLRGGLNVIAMLLFFMALSLAPLAKITALNFSAPLFSTLLAYVVLRERLRLPRVIALAIGFIGTLVILRPGMVEFDLGATLVLISALAWGAAMIVIKSLARTETSLTITLYLGLIVSPLALIAAVPVWQTPTSGQFIWLLGIAFFGTIANFAMAQAFRDAEATTVLPLDFTKLIWASAIGYVAFGQIPDVWSWIGAAMIIAAVTYIAYREDRAAQ
jgi:drug/metabolite transporter (DMT)-like permease